MRVTCLKGLVTIDSKDVSFAFNKDMYLREHGANGVGIQVRAGLEDKETKLIEILEKVSELIIEYDELVHE